MFRLFNIIKREHFYFRQLYVEQLIYYIHHSLQVDFIFSSDLQQWIVLH
jgi:hypothetical protein